MQSFYDDKIYDAQIRTGNEIIYSHFNCSITGTGQQRWTMLVAQMQSGKTGTYLFTAFEMLTQNLVSNVVIFSGNREIELREQTEKGLDDFVFKYSLYLSEVVDWDERERMRKSREALSKIRVVWGSGLKKEPNFPMKKTLFIFDESHYAQNKGMQVDKFLTKIGISATGEGLEASDNYVLSVSATPMSELSDAIHFTQTKGMVYLEPGPSYYGVADMRENGNIVGFESEDLCETLISALHRPSADAYKYALIRMTTSSSSGKKEKEEEEDLESIRQAIEIATRAGWICRFCDSDLEREPSTKINIGDLEHAPTEGNTLVFLKGKCRMGQVVPKQHIAFGMETSKNPNTDVMLQSLLGRFCGHDHNKNIIVYLPQKVVSSGELEKYIHMCSGLSERRAIEMIPTKSKNIIPEKNPDVEQEPKLHEIIPLKFPGLALSKDGLTLVDSKDIKRKILDHFHGKQLQTVENLNTQEQYQDIQTTIVEQRTIDCENGRILQDVKVRVANVNLENKTYLPLPEKYREAFDTHSVPSLPAACAPNACGQIVRLFVFGNLENDNYHGFQKGDVFLDIRISTANQLKKHIPKTTGREIFRHTMETGEAVAMNGAMMLGLDPETHCNVELMHQGLRQFIQLSLRGAGGAGGAGAGGVIYPRRINSVINTDGESSGILMSQEVYNAVKPGGRVFLEIKAEFNVDLVLKKGKGNFKIAPDVYASWIKFIEISW